MKNFTLMILCAGFGSRMLNLTRSTPKPLLKYKNKVVIVTSSRAEYGLLANLIKLLNRSKKFHLELVVIGQHLSKKYGMTVNQFFKSKIGSSG